VTASGEPQDKELEELQGFLELVLVEGSDVVNQWELEFVASLQKRLGKFQLSPKQKEKLFNIKKKMIKEELCDEDDYAQI